jgi:hypothetical protein
MRGSARESTPSGQVPQLLARRGGTAAALPRDVALQPRRVALLLLVLLGAWPAGAGTPVRLTLSAEGEQFRALIQDNPLTRSALTAGARLTYDDQLHLHGACAVEWRADRILPERDRVFVAEGYAAVAAGPAEIALGRQQLRWGRLDSLRPTDVFRRRDLTDPLEDRDEPIWAARFDLYTGAAAFEAVWVPVFEPDILSFDERNPWCLFPDSVTVPDLGVVPADFEMGRQTAPGENTTSQEYGVHLDLHSGGWDFGACAARAYESMPTFVDPVDSLLTADGRAHIRVDLAHAPLAVAGADLARSLGAGTLRAEVARVWPKEVAGREAEGPYMRAGIGLDRTFARIGLGGDLNVLLQYSFDEACCDSALQGIARYRHLFRHGGLVRLRAEPGRFTRVDVETLADLERGDRFTKIELTWSPEMGLAVIAGLLLVDGTEEGMLGRFRADDRIRLQVRYAWSTGP